MPSVVVNDDSIGESLGALAKGFSAANDPKRRAEAMYIQQRINLTAQQAQALADQRALAESTSGAYNTALAHQRTQIQPRISVLPGPDEMGPLQQTTPNPQLAEFDANAPFARNVMAGSLVHATSAQDYAGGAGRAYGIGQLTTSGMPSTQTGALKLGGIMEGKLLDASKPYTAGEAERQRVLANEEAVRKYQFEQEQAAARNNADNAMKLRLQREGDLSLDPNKRVILHPDRAAALGQPVEPATPSLLGDKQTLTRADGTVVSGPGVGPNATADNPFAFGGNAIDARAYDILREYNTLKRTNPSAITPEIEESAVRADDHLYGVKLEGRKNDKGEEYWVKTRRERPPGFVAPGAAAAAIEPPAQTVPPVNTTAVPAISGVTGGPPIATSTPGAPAGAPDSPIISVKPGVTPPPGADFGRRVGYVGSASTGALELVDMLEKGYRPAAGAQIASRLGGPRTEQSGAGHEILRMGGRVLQNAQDPNFEKYRGATFSLLNFLLRDESGAVIGQGEYDRYEQALVPGPLDRESDVQDKVKRMGEVLKMREMGVSAERISEFLGVPVDQRIKTQIETSRVQFNNMTPEQKAAYQGMWSAQRREPTAAAPPTATPAAAPVFDFTAADRIVGGARR